MTDAQLLREWIEGGEVFQGKMYKVPVTFRLGKGLAALEEAYLGFGKEILEEKWRLLEYSDARMGIGLEMTLRNKVKLENGFYACWIIGSWGKEISPTENKKPVFYLRKVINDTI